MLLSYAKLLIKLVNTIKLTTSQLAIASIKAISKYVETCGSLQQLLLSYSLDVARQLERAH